MTRCPIRCAITARRCPAWRRPTSRSTLRAASSAARRSSGISTRALKGDDATYAALEDKIVDLTEQRNDIAGKMIAMLEGAAFQGQAIDEDEAEHLINQANDLLAPID